jgi:hypothetical protein
VLVLVELVEWLVVLLLVEMVELNELELDELDELELDVVIPDVEEVLVEAFAVVEEEVVGGAFDLQQI